MSTNSTTLSNVAVKRRAAVAEPKDDIIMLIGLELTRNFYFKIEYLQSQKDENLVHTYDFTSTSPWWWLMSFLKATRHDPSVHWLRSATAFHRNWSVILSSSRVSLALLIAVNDSKSPAELFSSETINYDRSFSWINMMLRHVYE